MRTGLVPGAVAALVLACGGCGGGDRIKSEDGLALAEPGTVDFGRVALGSTKVRELRLRNVGRAPLTVQSLAVEGLGDDLELVERGSRRIPGGEELVLEVRYRPEVEAVLERTLTLVVDARDEPELVVPVTGISLRPRVLPEPTSLDFGRVELGVPERRTLALVNDFDMPVEIRLSGRGDGQFRWEPSGTVTVAPSSRLELEVTFLPIRAGEATADLLVLPCPTCAEMPVGLRGFGIDRALKVDPPVLDFGNVPIDRAAHRELTLTNDGSRPLDVFAVELEPGHPAFGASSLAARLAAGESVKVPVTFGPTRLGLDESGLRVRTSSVREPESRIVVRGIGGGPEISVVPGSLDFGAVPEGGLYTRTVRITNVGADPTLPPLEIPAVAVVGSPEFAAPLPAPLVIGPGEFADLAITYEPTGAGADGGEVVISSNDGSTPEVRVPVRGGAIPAPPCTLSLTPGAIDFGTLDPGRGAVLGFTLRNVGADVCVLRDVRIAPGSHPAFRMPGQPIGGFLLGAGQWFGRMVAFDPKPVGAGEGAYAGELEVWIVENGVRRRQAIPLTASSARGCLVPSPRFLDFGNSAVECGGEEGTIVFENVCSGPVDVSGIAVGPANNPGEFALAAAPAAPFDVDPGDEFEVRVAWLARTRGAVYAPLYVEEAGRPAPLLVPLLADLGQSGERVERFTQHQAGAVDVLLVVDNSSSMAEEQRRIAQSVGVLVDAANARGIDYRIAVTTTGLIPAGGSPRCPGGVDGGEAGRFFPVDRGRPRIVTQGTPDGRDHLIANTQVGYCHYLEQGMEAMRLALSDPLVSSADDPSTPWPADGNAGFLRTAAQLAVVFISEEDDHSGYPVEEYEAFLDDLKGGGAVVSAIVDVDDRCAGASGVAHRYVDLVDRTGGVALSLCEGDWAPLFRGIADRSFTPQDLFYLDEVPDAAGVTVTVDGAEVPPGDYVLDRALNAIRFVPGARPRDGARIVVRYVRACP